MIKVADTEEVYVRDLFKKHKGRPEYKGLYSSGKKVYQDNGEIYNEGFAMDEENLRILKARIEAIFIDETKPKDWVNNNAGSNRRDITKVIFLMGAKATKFKQYQYNW